MFSATDGLGDSNGCLVMTASLAATESTVLRNRSIDAGAMRERYGTLAACRSIKMGARPSVGSSPVLALAATTRDSFSLRSGLIRA
jgi:hypothetical protein